MHSRKFESKEALVAYAKQNGLTCLSESFAKWQQLLSPKEYLLVEVRTSDGHASGHVVAQGDVESGLGG
jgi:methylase of polypeptide subunit release factors